MERNIEVPVSIIRAINDVKHIALTPRYLRRLASEAEILALMPELKPPG